MILSASPLEQNRILGNTDLGEVVEAAPPTSDGSEGKLRSYCLEVMSLSGAWGCWSETPILSLVAGV